VGVFEEKSLENIKIGEEACFEVEVKIKGI